MYNIFQKKIYIKHYNIICASHEQLTSNIRNWNINLERMKKIIT